MGTTSPRLLPHCPPTNPAFAPPPRTPLQDEWPLLIVVPASLRLVWAEELERWLPHLRPASIHVIEGKGDRVGAGALPLVTITRWGTGWVWWGMAVGKPA